MNDTDEDRAAIQPLINQEVAYPLSEFDGEMKPIEWARVEDIPTPDAGTGAETRWVVPENYLDQFPEILEMVPAATASRNLSTLWKPLLKWYRAAPLEPWWRVMLSCDRFLAVQRRRRARSERLLRCSSSSSWLRCGEHQWPTSTRRRRSRVRTSVRCGP